MKSKSQQSSFTRYHCKASKRDKQGERAGASTNGRASLRKWLSTQLWALRKLLLKAGLMPPALMPIPVLCAVATAAPANISACFWDLLLAFFLFAPPLPPLLLLRFFFFFLTWLWNIRFDEGKAIQHLLTEGGWFSFATKWLIFTFLAPGRVKSERSALHHHGNPGSSGLERMKGGDNGREDCPLTWHFSPHSGMCLVV